MFKVPEEYRLTQGELGSTKEFGNNGMFIIPNGAIKYYCMASDGLDWEHISVSIKKKNGVGLKRCPTWEEMCKIKDLFWNVDAAVMQLHPPEKDYINNHPYVLHLWRPIRYEIPLPDPIMVGMKHMNRPKKDNKEDPIRKEIMKKQAKKYIAELNRKHGL